MNDNKVYLEKRENGVACIFLNQPKKRNAISGAMMDELCEILRGAERDGEIKVLILRGAGEHFSSGGELGQGGPGGVTVESRRSMLKKYIEAVRTVRRIGKPVIAMVDGYAVGGAMSLALACDLVFVSDRAQFIPNFCNIGIIPEMGIMSVLPQLIGPHRAKELLFTGKSVSGQQACAMGLVNHMFSPETLEEEVLAAALELAKQPLTSLSITKGIMNSASDTNMDSVMEAEATASPFCTQTQAYRDAAQRFSKK